MNESKTIMIADLAKSIDMTKLTEHEFNRYEGGITVEHLAIIALQQIAKGNGMKKVYISSDEEGNDFHPAYFDIDDDIETIRMVESIKEEDEEKIVLLG